MSKCSPEVLPGNSRELCERLCRDWGIWHACHSIDVKALVTASAVECDETRWHCHRNFMPRAQDHRADAASQNPITKHVKPSNVARAMYAPALLFSDVSLGSRAKLPVRAAGLKTVSVSPCGWWWEV